MIAPEGTTKPGHCLLRCVTRPSRLMGRLIALLPAI